MDCLPVLRRRLRSFGRHISIRIIILKLKFTVCINIHLNIYRTKNGEKYSIRFLDISSKRDSWNTLKVRSPICGATLEKPLLISRNFMLFRETQNSILPFVRILSRCTKCVNIFYPFKAIEKSQNNCRTIIVHTCNFASFAEAVRCKLNAGGTLSSCDHRTLNSLYSNNHRPFARIWSLLTGMKRTKIAARNAFVTVVIVRKFFSWAHQTPYIREAR